MDNKKWEALRGSAGFYITLAVCLLVVGVSGWMLLSDRGKEPAAVEEDFVPEVSAPAPQVMKEEPDGSPMTAHTTNPVPFILCGAGTELRSGGRLADIAPTMLDVMGLACPEEMDGKTLIVK